MLVPSLRHSSMMASATPEGEGSLPVALSSSKPELALTDIVSLRGALGPRPASSMSRRAASARQQGVHGHPTPVQTSWPINGMNPRNFNDVAASLGRFSRANNVLKES